MNIDQIKKEFKEIRDSLFGGSANIQQTQKLLVIVSDLGQEVERLTKNLEEMEKHKDKHINDLTIRKTELLDKLDKIADILGDDYFL